MNKFLVLTLITSILTICSSGSNAEPDFVYRDISLVSGDVNGDGRSETVRLAGEIDRNKYDIDSYDSFEYEFLEFVNTRLFIEDYRGVILHSMAVPQGLFEKLVLADFDNNGSQDILFTFHDPDYPNIDHKVLSFKDNMLSELFNGELGHNGLDSTKYISLAVKDKYGISLKSPISSLNVNTVLSKQNRHMYDKFYNSDGSLIDGNLVYMSYPYLSEVELMRSGSALLEFSKLKSHIGEEILSLQTTYTWKNSKWIPTSITAIPLNYSINVKLNDRYLFFDSEPVVVNNRTLVPMRAIFEALGADISWDQNTSTVSAYKNGVSVKVKLDEKTAYINNTRFELDVPPIAVDERTMVPVRFVSEALGAEVTWDEVKYEVVIKK